MLIKMGERVHILLSNKKFTFLKADLNGKYLVEWLGFKHWQAQCPHQV
jgi:hypothetical protein